MPSASTSMIGNEELSDFFGGAWDYNPNTTFSDLQLDPCWEMPVTSRSDAFNPREEQASRDPLPTIHGSPSSQPSSGSSSFSATSNKPKPLNLYETLRRSQMVPHLLLSPVGGYGDAIHGLEWTPPQPMVPTIDRGSNGLFPPSPSTIIDPSQCLFMQPLKRPRVSPILTNMPSDHMMSNGFLPFGGGLLWPTNMIPTRRTAKMPLSPVIKPEKKVEPLGDLNEKGPIVLPFIAQQANNNVSQRPKAPVKLLPASSIGASQTESKVKPIATLEENIEKNLRSFLRETKDLQWENVTVIELKKILRQYELNATGKKAELMARIEKIRKSYKHLEEEIVTHCNPNDSFNT